MKYFKTIISMIIVVLLFSSCSSFKLASSIDELISPISPTGRDAGVQQSLNSYCSGGFSVKIPSFGEYTTAYVYYDFDSDGVEEALAFYEPNKNLGTIDMAVLEQGEDEKWTVVENITGDGTDIYSVDFSDINGDGAIELLISWNAIANSTSHLLDIYSQYIDEKGAFALVKSTQFTYTNYTAVDLTNDGKNELLILSIDQAKATASATLYSITGDKKKKLGQTKIDGHISSFKNVISGKSDSINVVYVDAIKSDGASMVTELLYWSNRYDNIISPFYSYSSGLTSETTRNAMVYSCDINNDSIIEVPDDAKVKGLPSEVFAVEWKQYKSSVLLHSAYSIASATDNYQVLIPDDSFKKISVLYDSETKQMTLINKDDKTEIFEIIPLLKSHFEDNKNSYDGYTQILENSGYVYLAKTFENPSINYSIDDLKNMIKAY